MNQKHRVKLLDSISNVNRLGSCLAEHFKEHAGSEDNRGSSGDFQRDYWGIGNY